MLMDVYFAEMKKVLDKIEKTQRENIIKAADFAVESLINNGMFHVYDTGHMLMFEGVGRTGGLMSLRPVKVECTVNNPTRFRDRNGAKKVTYDMVDGFADYVLGQMNLQKGDTFIIGSVSGYNNLPVELALRAREMGVKTIAITSVEYSSQLKSAHKSNLRLFGAVDVCLDNCSNFGDTLVEVPALGHKVCPSSGIGASYLMWALQSTVIEKIVEKGLQPSVYISNHMPNASKINSDSWANYEKNGY